jgi:hypothetical protein
VTSRPCALDAPGTRQALRQYRLRALVACVAGATAWVLAALLQVATGSPHRGGAAAGLALLTVGGFVPLAGGVLGLAHSLRLARALRAYPWVPWESQFREVSLAAPLGEPTLFLGADGGHVLTLVAFSWRWGPLAEARTVWLAGPPERGGVVSTPGGTYLVWCRRPRWQWYRTALLRRVRARAVATPGHGAMAQTSQRLGP